MCKERCRCGEFGLNFAKNENLQCCVCAIFALDALMSLRDLRMFKWDCFGFGDLIVFDLIEIWIGLGCSIFDNLFDIHVLYFVTIHCHYCLSYEFSLFNQCWISQCDNFYYNYSFVLLCDDKMRYAEFLFFIYPSNLFYYFY